MFHYNVYNDSGVKPSSSSWLPSNIKKIVAAAAVAATTKSINLRCAVLIVTIGDGHGIIDLM